MSTTPHTIRHRLSRAGLGTALVIAVAGCSFGGLFRDEPTVVAPESRAEREMRGESGSTIWDLFSGVDEPNTAIEVNKYLWNASLEVLNFLPVQTVDPFSGLIVTGFGTPTGGGRSYRAAVHVSDPALDARSLHIALMTSGGPAAPATVRALEDAILTRARQLRIRDSGL
jgi:hypothetical protein